MFTIGNESDHVSIDVLGQTYPGPELWRRGFFSTKVDVVLGTLCLSYFGNVDIEQLERFHNELLDGYKNLSGSVSFDCEASQFTAVCEFKALGHVLWNIELTPRGSSADEFTVRFTIGSDQSYLPTILYQLEAIISEFAKEP